LLIGWTCGVGGSGEAGQGAELVSVSSDGNTGGAVVSDVWESLPSWGEGITRSSLISENNDISAGVEGQILRSTPNIVGGSGGQLTESDSAVLASKAWVADTILSEGAQRWGVEEGVGEGWQTPNLTILVQLGQNCKTSGGSGFNDGESWKEI